MRLTNDGWTFSPTDLATFTRCQHAIQLRKRSRIGTLQRFAPPNTSIRAEMLARRGGEHEDAYVDSLKKKNKSIVEISREDGDAAAKTIDAMSGGVDVVVQGALRHGDWLGYADLLERVPSASSFGAWSYEIADTKLAMSVQPYFILQLGIYNEILGLLQGLMPRSMHLILGDGSRHTFASGDYSSYLSRIRGRFLSGFASEVETLPYPVDYCALCEWNRHCWLHLLDLDHLSLVANIRRDHVKLLQAGGIQTLSSLAIVNPAVPVDKIAAPILERLHHQARLQLEARRTGKHRYEFLETEERRGFQLLPRPSPGDLFFDVEADPFEDLTYLLGMAFLEGTQPRYRGWWSHDPAQERRSFEEVVDFIIERRRQYPEAHIYHYGAADVSTLKTLMGRYGTREDALDDLLRKEAFVDLLAVVRQSIRISHPSYSLKKVETFYFDRQSEGVIDAGGAIVAYENWLQDQDPEKLKEIEEYNRDDCMSTVELQAWLLKLRQELEKERGITLVWRQPRTPDPTSEERERERMEADQLAVVLLGGLPEERSTWSEEQVARWRLAHLLHYHRRENKPVWWTFFDRLKMSPDELFEDNECIGGLSPTGSRRPIARSVATEFRFEPQQHKFHRGDAVFDPHRLNDTGWPESAGTIEDIDDEEGLVELKRGDGFTPDTLPRSIVPGGAVPTTNIQAALRRLAKSVVDDGFNTTPYQASRDLLLRSLPRITGQTPGTALHGAHIDEATVKSLAAGLTDSYLFIQGPPGTGKTYYGARIIVDLIRRGKRIGVTATSHKAIENMLHEVERVADSEGVWFRGLKQSSNQSQAFRSKLDSPRIVDITDKFERGQKPEPSDADIQLVAGTAWLFSRNEHDRQFDYLVVDEAGQMSLADAIASSTSACNVLLLGDPLQLAQVSQGTHPEGCGSSVLEHLLGEAATIPPERGVFLEQTRRMHPDVCRFISDVVYDSRLESHEQCTVRRVEAPLISGTGLRLHTVIHEGNSQQSIEEAEWIADSIAVMISAGFSIDGDGLRTKLASMDFLVVTPYNAQVSAIRRSLQRRGLTVPVGTVDKFQGQEAAIVFFSMATSSGDDIPRTLDFLFSRNRLNVAVSRARCLAILVCSPKLLDVECRTVEQMRLVNALCRFVEMAESV